MAWVSLASTHQSGLSPTTLPYLLGESITTIHTRSTLLSTDISLCMYHAMFCGLHSGLSVGIYASNGPDACLYVLGDCKANVVVVEDQKQLDKILQVNKLPIIIS